MNVTFAMLNGWEIVLIIAAILILFGAKKLPELARGFGQGIREFRKATREVTDELQSAVDYDSPSVPSRKIPSNTAARTSETAETPAEQVPAADPKSQA